MATASRSSREANFDEKFESLKREIIETFDSLFQALEKRRHELLTRLSSMKAGYDKNVSLEEAIKQLRLVRQTANEVMTSNVSVLDPIQEAVDTQIREREAMKMSVQDVNLVEFRSFSERILQSIEDTDLVELIPEYVGRKNPILKKCGWGTRKGEIANGRGIAFDKKTNEIYIVDKSNHRIQVFSGEGDFIRMFGRDLLVDGIGICISDDAVYVTDRGNLLVIKFNKSGKCIRKTGSRGTSPGCFSSIQGMCYDDGLLYVCEFSFQRIYIFDSKLNFLKDFGSGLVKTPNDIKIHSGLIYILSQDCNSIYCYSKGCQHINTIQLRGMMESTFYIFFVIDYKGNFITTTTSSVILVFSPEGVLKHKLGEGHLRNLHGIALDNTNKIICVNGTKNNDCFQIY